MEHNFTLPDALDMMNLTSRFYEALDNRDYERALACFAQNGIWWRRGKPVKGLLAIEDALKARPANFHTCHVISNIQVFLREQEEGSVRFYMTGHPFHGDIEQGTYKPLPEAHIVATYEDEMKKINGAWKIIEKKMIKTAFKNNAALP